MKIPNILTIGRIIIVPIFVLTFFIPGFFGDLIPFFIFILASFTDYLDGLLARLFKEESKLGEILDPSLQDAIPFTNDGKSDETLLNQLSNSLNSVAGLVIGLHVINFILTPLFNYSYLIIKTFK